MFDADVETRASVEQVARDNGLYRRQVEYLFARSPFYQRKLRASGFRSPADVGGVDRIAALPFTQRMKSARPKPKHRLSGTIWLWIQNLCCECIPRAARPVRRALSP